MKLENALYIVSTPIGNLDDITERAKQVLSGVDRIAAEDTRRTGQLLSQYGIQGRMMPLHDHNEKARAAQLLDLVLKGESVALVSDAGTPLISDPGFYLVREAHKLGVVVVPVPGVSAGVVGVSVSGLPSDRFCFEGFLPAKAGARKQRLERLVTEERTLVFYESPHRIVASLQAMAEVFGEGRLVCVCRELTKTFETIKLAPLQELLEWVQADTNQQRGEFVLVVAGADAAEDGDEEEAAAEAVLRVLLEELSVKQSSALAAKITGVNKKKLYRRALELKG